MIILYIDASYEVLPAERHGLQQGGGLECRDPYHPYIPDMTVIHVIIAITVIITIVH